MTTKRTFDDFDHFANDYRQIHTDNVRISGADSFYFAEMKVSLLTPLENNIKLKVLDVGCGDGVTELFMEKYFPSWEVRGIDVSDKSIQKASERNLANALFSKYDGLNIPYPGKTFDIVFIAGVLHHVDFKFHNALLDSIYSVLKPGGRLYLYEHNPLNPLTKYLVKTCVFDKEARLLGIGYTTRLLQKKGFKNLVKSFIIFFPRKGLLSRLIFLEKYLKRVPFGGQYMIRAIRP